MPLLRHPGCRWSSAPRRRAAPFGCDNYHAAFCGSPASEAGSLTFDVLETPGHTPGGITYRCEDCLFTGDTLFRMSCGRYDFPGSSSLDLGHSLEKLRDLPGDYEVYPGHEGSTSLEYERRFNPYMLRPWDL